VLETIWTHAKDRAKQEQEEKRKQCEAEEEVRTEYLRSFHVGLGQTLYLLYEVMRIPREDTLCGLPAEA